MIYDKIIIQTLFVIMLIQMIGFGIYLKKNNKSMGGVSPINPILFKTGKVLMFICWIALFVQASRFYNLNIFNRSHELTIAAVIIFALGSALQFFAYVNLGKNLKFGIPDENEKKSSTLKVKGIYRISRNPMYTGFTLMLLASCLYVLNPGIWTAAIIITIIHHKIVLKEEKFLKDILPTEWNVYSTKVRRYL